MTDHSSGLTSTEQWQALAGTGTGSGSSRCGSCSAKTRIGPARYFIEAAGLGLDFSKNLITDETLALLVELAQRQGLESRRRALLSGQPGQLHRGPARAPHRPAGPRQPRDPG